jgi:hypothetical protein
LKAACEIYSNLELDKGEVTIMAKPNYSFEKRKKELDRQKKKDEKKARKGEQNADGTEQEEGAEGSETVVAAE